MNYQVITLFPELIEQNFAVGVIGQAKEKGLLKLQTINPRQFAEDIHRSVDDRPYGGGDGMIMLAEILAKSIESIPLEQRGRVIYLSPQGRPLQDQKVRELAKEKDLTLICGRYGGIDQRVINQYVDEEISIGDYVLSGGELAACVLIDAVSRMIPGVLGHGGSKDLDSFSEGLLESPNFTRPNRCLDQTVPEILLSGDHRKREAWRRTVSKLITFKKRPDLLEKKITKEEINELRNFLNQLSASEKTALGLEGWVL